MLAAEPRAARSGLAHSLVQDGLRWQLAEQVAEHPPAHSTVRTAAARKRSTEAAGRLAALELPSSCPQGRTPPARRARQPRQLLEGAGSSIPALEERTWPSRCWKGDRTTSDGLTSPHELLALLRRGPCLGLNGRSVLCLVLADGRTTGSLRRRFGNTRRAHGACRVTGGVGRPSAPLPRPPRRRSSGVAAAESLLGGGCRDICGRGVSARHAVQDAA